MGVKNVAERLCKDGVNFRLLVAKEFYVEWYVRSHHDFQSLQFVIKNNPYLKARAHLRAESRGTPDPHGPTAG